MTRRRLPRNDAAILDAAVLLDGEIAYDTTNNELRIGDGVTAGGVAIIDAETLAASGGAALIGSPFSGTLATDISGLLGSVSSLQNAVANDANIATQTLAQLNALAGPFTGGQLAIVVNDTTNTGRYSRIGSAWTRIGDLPEQTAVAAAASVSGVTGEAQIGLGFGASAARLFEASGSITPSVFRGHTPSNGITYELVVIARPQGTRRFINVFNNGSTAADVTFNLEDGSAVTNTGTAIGSSRYLGGGFYECKTTSTSTGTTTGNWQVRPSPDGTLPFTGNTSEGVWVKSIVLRQQGATTNLFTSSDPTNAAFSKLNVTTTAGTTPEQRTSELIKAIEADVTSLETFVNGSLIADKLIEGSGSVSPSLFRVVNYTSGSTYVFTYELKAGERNRVNVFNNGTGFLIDVTADLSTGVVSIISADTTATLTALNNNCYRLVVTKVASANGSGNTQLRIYPSAGGHPYTGDGTSGVFLNSATLSVNGGANVWSSPTDFTSGGWSKLSLTVTSNTGLWLGLPTITGSSGSPALHPLNGKKVVVLGTSLVEQNFWTSAFQAETGCILLNRGVSGSSYGLSSSYSDSRIGQASGKLNTTDIPADTVLIIADNPVNDPFWRVPVGAASDTTTATFAGAMANVSIWAAANRPNAQVLYTQLTSAQPGNPTRRHGGLASGGQPTVAELSVYQAMLAEIARREGRPLVDLNDFGISWRRTDIRSDLLHWNTFGGAWIARILEAETRRLAEEGWLVI